MTESRPDVQGDLRQATVNSCWHEIHHLQHFMTLHISVAAPGLQDSSEVSTKKTSSHFHPLIHVSPWSLHRIMSIKTRAWLWQYMLLSQNVHKINSSLAGALVTFSTHPMVCVFMFYAELSLKPLKVNYNSC